MSERSFFWNDGGTSARLLGAPGKEVLVRIRQSKGELRKGSCRTKGSGLIKLLLAEAQRATRITSVLRLTRIGSFIFRLPDATEYWSPETFQIFGVDPAKGHPRNMSEYMAYVHPDDRERFLRETEEILANGQARSNMCA